MIFYVSKKYNFISINQTISFVHSSVIFDFRKKILQSSLSENCVARFRDNQSYCCVLTHDDGDVTSDTSLYLKLLIGNFGCFANQANQA